MKYLKIIIALIISIILILFNIPFFQAENSFTEQKEEVIKQLNYIENELNHNNLAEKMQKTYPEGYVFINAIYALSWCELALADKNDSSLKKEALNEALKVYSNLNSKIAKSTYNEDLKPEYGIFYLGWKNYLLSKILDIQGTDKSSILIDDYILNCDNIAKELNDTNKIYLESYTGLRWPADMFVGMTSLSNFKNIIDNRYDSIVQSWLASSLKSTDPESGLFYHKVSNKKGERQKGIRGSSSSLIIRLLYEMDRGIGDKHIKKFDKHFHSEFLGAAILREYPKGESGKGDIDSGPVLFDIGPVSTIMMLGNYSIYGQEEKARKLYNAIDIFAFSDYYSDSKEYLFGAYPMADAFIAWGLASQLHYSKQKNIKTQGVNLILFNYISIIIFILIWGLYFRKKIFKSVSDLNTKGNKV